MWLIPLFKKLKSKVLDEYYVHSLLAIKNEIMMRLELEVLGTRLLIK
jgi:hypothetical protein